MERRVLKDTQWQGIPLGPKRPQDHWNRAHKGPHSEERQQDHYRYAHTFHRVISHRPGNLGDLYSNFYFAALPSRARRSTEVRVEEGRDTASRIHCGWFV